MLPTVNQVLNEIKYHQINHECQYRLIRSAWPPKFKVEGRKAHDAKLTNQVIDQGVYTEEHQQLEQAKPMDGGVQNVNSHSAPVSDFEHWKCHFKGVKNSKHHSKLQHPH